MKRILSLIIVLLLLGSGCALAFMGTDYPTWSGENLPDNCLGGEMDALNLLMDFDPQAEYSNIADGMIQACFFAFDKTETNYLELYLKLPENAAAGNVYSTSDISSAASISLYEVNQSGEVFYFASQVLGVAYPGGSSYEIHLQEVSRNAESLTVRGTLSARLCKFDDINPTEEYLDLTGIQFSFDLPLSTSAAPQQPSKEPLPSATPAPDFKPEPERSAAPSVQAPRATMDPHPAFTLPPDYRVI